MDAVLIYRGSNPDGNDQRNGTNPGPAGTEDEGEIVVKVKNRSILVKEPSASMSAHSTQAGWTFRSQIARAI
jgi:hypothetical protein